MPGWVPVWALLPWHCPGCIAAACLLLLCGRRSWALQCRNTVSTMQRQQPNRRCSCVPPRLPVCLASHPSVAGHRPGPAAPAGRRRRGQLWARLQRLLLCHVTVLVPGAALVCCWHALDANQWLNCSFTPAVLGNLHVLLPVEAGRSTASSTLRRRRPLRLVFV